MLTLGIDTATSVCSLALYNGQSVIAEYTVDNGFTHSEKMMPQLEAMLDNSSVSKKKLAGICVSIGPGSFTGLRIGLSAAKAISYALGIPVCGVPTMDALAYNLPVPGIWLSPLLDGQKGNVYQAVYEWRKGRLAQISPISHLLYQEALALLAQSNKTCLLLGENVLSGSDAVLPANVSWAPAHARLPRAASVAVLGYERLAKGDSDDVFTLEPYYMKKSEAEILWEQKKKLF